MNLISFLSTRAAPILGLLLVKVLNRERSYRLADWLADRIASREESDLIRTVRANQAVIRGLPYDAPELGDAVREVMRNAARGYTDWFRVTNEGPDAVERTVELDASLLRFLQRYNDSDHGWVVVGAHMSSFNVLLLALGVHGFPIQVLSLANVQGGVHVDNAVRRRFGLYLTPIGPKALKEAIRRLRDGGMVMTAVDRPDVGGKELTFFGRKAVLPIGPARLALATDSKVLVGMTQTIGPGKYRGVAADPIEPVRTGDFEADIRNLAQRILAVVENYIRSQPGEWLMFHPIWPDAVPALPET